MKRTFYEYHPARAFTLIELMIVICILPITAGAILALTDGLNNGRQRAEARLSAHEAATAAAARWRTDVELASRIEIAPDGHAMTLWRPDRQGGRQRVHYALSAQGQIQRTVGQGEGSGPEIRPESKPEIPVTKSAERGVRSAEKSKSEKTPEIRLESKPEILVPKSAEKIGPENRPEILAPEASGLEFVQVGRGYRAQWTSEARDGIQTWRWPQAVFATPLAAGEERS